ncbi:MAG: hypothetical protein KBA06_05260 [Saprospiraceae bacterium]|nr:hypothetical protein [Saprospiraceae bacterium]
MTQNERDYIEQCKVLATDQQRLFDIARECRFSLWNSLLTFNALIITVFTGFLALHPTSNRTIIFCIIFLSIASAGLLIFNFKATKQFYDRSALDYFNMLDRQSNLGHNDEVADNLIQQNQAGRIQTIVNLFENLALVFLGLQMVLIIIFICR